jgi:hypothetical protein
MVMVVSNSLLVSLCRYLTRRDRRRPIREQLRRFFGPDLERLQTHDKHFPGYDLASLYRALESYREECCTASQEVGSCQAMTVRLLLDWLPQPHFRQRKPDPPTYQRVPIDVDKEVSVVTNCLYLLEIRPPDGSDAPPDKVAVILAADTRGPDYWDGMETNRVTAPQVIVSIACLSRDIADGFFAALEERRKRLSIFRGKAIEPSLHGGVVYAIGFRALKQVREMDLILPEDIKLLLRGAIVGFYAHRDILIDLGIEMKRGILLHGPPGTGKTSISLYLAGLLPGFTVCFVSGERLLYPREICRMARYLQPAMVVFEDIDLVAQDRDANGLATVLGELMNQIDGCEPTDQVLFIMTTNSIDRLESAVKDRPGRVDQIVQIPLPDPAARGQLLRHFARNLPLAFDDLGKVLDATDGMTPAMLKEIVKRAAVSAVERDGGIELALDEADLLLAAEQVQAMRARIVQQGNLGFGRRNLAR